MAAQINSKPKRAIKTLPTRKLVMIQSPCNISTSALAMRFLRRLSLRITSSLNLLGFRKIQTPNKFRTSPNKPHPNRSNIFLNLTGKIFKRREICIAEETPNQNDIGLGSNNQPIIGPFPALASRISYLYQPHFR